MVEQASDDGDDDAVRFRHVRSNFYRTMHIDGCVATITPKGYIHVEVYSERRTIPRVTEQTYNPDGTIADQRIVAYSGGVTREIEADLILDVVAARQIAHQLLGLAREVEKMMGIEPPQPGRA